MMIYCYILDCNLDFELWNPVLFFWLLEIISTGRGSGVVKKRLTRYKKDSSLRPYEAAFFEGIQSVFYDIVLSAYILRPA